MNDCELTGQVALITGARRGLGRAIALRLARAGADVAINDIAGGEPEAEEVIQMVEKLGRRACFLPGSVADSAQADAVVSGALAELGRLDVLVNNAGITRDALLVRMADEEWRSVLEVNLSGVFNCTRAAARAMMRARSGRIVNIASVVGLIGNVGQANYSASKAGVIALTKTAARELASRGIRVNAVAPGFIVSPMTDSLPEQVKDRLLSQIPLTRLGQPEEVAEVVLFLAGSASSYLTGQVIRVDGGMVM